MILAEGEAQIIRIQSQDSPPELLAALEATLKREVMMVTNSTIETTLVEQTARPKQVHNRDVQAISLGDSIQSMVELITSKCPSSDGEIKSASGKFSSAISVDWTAY